ncbi:MULTISPECIES: NAD(P)/FAD-dependent oxidoreductase [unclassified Nocardioides]|uniref:NAD(P)/FAD-dependent oxidoreductase n=1 Tax=unclassified Nocardioides TaxID=2615069 RepID=UPI0006F20F3C|nr:MULTISPECIES: NAD(P)/FAD-dependent oxidoreductase [unclassified Nocardioides]KRA37820.1 oxidoreductase [Nocardioides sp. Root614]KRA91780.1 oxidoreductase [Nocardioides sp. Root682]
MTYDAIVIGARAAGSPTAMLLARKGYRVLAVDRATFPSDTLSTHVIHAPGVAALKRWGLLDALLESGCPAMTRYRLDFGPVVISGTSEPVEGTTTAYAPRRTVLDAVLVAGARAAGVEVREDHNVDELLIEDGRVVGIRSGQREDRARIVIGADGRNSHVAKAVHAVDYNTKPRLQYSYYAYFSGLPTDQFEIFIRPDRGFACAPTNDGQTMIVAGWPYAEAQAYKADVEGNFLKTLQMAPEFAERVATAKRESPFLGGSVPSWFRQPYGDGWALVGDAGYNKDPITGQGITDAFLDAERCTDAIHRWLGEGEDFDEAMGAWHHERDTKDLPIYEFTAQLATLELPPPEMQQLLGAVQGNQEAMDGFVSVISGAVSPADYFSEENVGRIFAASAAAAGPALAGSDR